MTPYSAVLVIAFLSVGCAIAEHKSPFKITTQRDDDRIEVTVQNNKSILSVHSPSGISQALIERTEETWPHVVTLRLHLKGLENLKISHGNGTLEAAVSSQDSSVRLWANGKEDSLLDSGSPYWMEIRLMDQDGKPTNDLPLTNGWFEMRLPSTLLEDNPKSITINWIDFYR